MAGRGKPARGLRVKIMENMVNNADYLYNIRFFTKISIFEKKFRFFTKIWIFHQNFDF